MKPIAKLDIKDLQSKFELKKINPDCFLIHFDNEYKLPVEPYRTNCFGICILHQGTTVLKTNLITHNVTAPAIITMGPNVIRSWIEKKDNVISDVIFFTEDFLNEKASTYFRLIDYSFFDNEFEHIFQINEDNYKKFRAIFGFISSTISDENNTNRYKIVKNLIAILINELENLNISKKKVAKADYHNLTIENFKKLLAKNFKKERSLAFYADTLYTTPKYLSEQIKKYCGKSARVYIDELVILEAKIMLQNLDYTIAEISDELNFANQSFFGKFFKAHTGLSPLQYKNDLIAREK